MMLCDVPLHPRTRSTKGPDCPNDIQKRLRSPRQHLDDRQHSINPLPKRPAIDQRTEFVRLVRIHELFRITDRYGERFDITHAVEKYGMAPSGFEFGIGKNSILPINHPEMIRSHEQDYPNLRSRQAKEQIIGASFEGDARSYAIRQIVRHEIVNETFGYTEAAVAY